MPSITFFLLIQAARRLDYAEEQSALTIASFPHMEEAAQNKVMRHYDRLSEYLFDTTEESTEGLAQLKEIQTQ